MVRLLAVKVGFLLNESFSASSESAAQIHLRTKSKRQAITSGLLILSDIKSDSGEFKDPKT